MKKNFLIPIILILFSFFNEIKAEEMPNISYQTHVENIGWMDAVTNGHISGTVGQRLQIEAIKIDINNNSIGGSITYQSNVQSIGMMNTVADGQISGTTGIGLQIESICISLTGEIANYYDVYYQVHVQGIGWLDWAKNGQESGSSGFGYQLESIKIVLVKKGELAPGATTSYYKEKKPSILYQTQVQNIGWQNFVTDGELSGTTGRGLPIETIVAYLQNNDIKGKMTYQSHVSNIGWMDIVKDGQISGTTNSRLPVEAIRISLTGEIANYYDVYYQTHVANFGWLDWAKNGQTAGSTGFGYPVEAVKVMLIKKGNPAPGPIDNHYKEKESSIIYKTYVRGIGWQNFTTDGQIAGTTGRGLPIESMLVSLINNNKTGGMTYQSHVSNIGWMDIVKDGQISGTINQGLQEEAIRISLTGEIANYYDVYYQTHITNVGWLDWAKNGQTAGSTGFGYQVEAIKIILVKKGEPAPGPTDNPYISQSGFIWQYENGIKSLYHTSTGLIGKNVKKIIDVSQHQGIIDWDTVKNKGDIDGVILRIGFGSVTEDSQFARNISELKRLNIPYGIYLFSYAENASEGKAEAEFIKSKINQYSLNPTLGIYLDLEDWNIGNYYPNITKQSYDLIINEFMNALNQSGYSATIYTYLRYAEQRLNPVVQQKINWIAQYNSSCQYRGYYKMWQYSSSGQIPGIKGMVDMNVWFNEK